jgi:hypothetical protein
MRITSFAILTLVACGAVFAATHSETTTYVDGNLTGISPNTGGTLSFTDDHGITLRTGLTTVAIPYSGISHAELGAVKETSHDVPLYKVWALGKRLGHKTETQLLIVNFKNEQGEEKSMTLELAKGSAESALTTIQARAGDDLEKNTAVASARPASSKKTPSPATKAAAAENNPDMAADGSWWGDKVWKTKSNQDKWNKPAATNAPDQQ